MDVREVVSWSTDDWVRAKVISFNCWHCSQDGTNVVILSVRESMF